MPYARQYEEYEVRILLKRSEINTSSITNQPAHSRALHATTASTVSPSASTVAFMSTSLLSGQAAASQGTSTQALRNRVHTTPRATQQSSAFGSLIHQGAAATQALNSATGQAALAALDGATTARRAFLQVAFRPLESSFAPTAVGISTTHVIREDRGDRTSRVRTTTAATTGVIMIVESSITDRNNIHIQTCYPSDDVNLQSTHRLI